MLLRDRRRRRLVGPVLAAQMGYLPGTMWIVFGVMTMVAASVLDQGLYFAMNAPAGVVGTTVQSASEAVTKLGFTISPDQLQAAAQSVQEQSLIARVGGAPTLAVGMSTIFSGAFGGRRRR